jgi:hypothetical protein
MAGTLCANTALRAGCPAMTAVGNLSSVANLCSAQLNVGRNRRDGASRQKNFEMKNISISDACAAVANQFVDRA